MIDLAQEKPISFNQACRYLPDERRPGFSTWWRWHRHGVRGVRLETVMVGGRRCTTREAVERFIRALTRAADGERASISDGSDLVEARAEAALAARGI